MSWLETYRRDGYAILPGLLDRSQIASLAEGFDRLIERARGLEGTTDVDGSRFVVKTDPFRLSRVVWCGGAEPSLRIGAHPAFLRVARAVLGQTELVQLIQQAHVKLPGDGIDYRWHQDASNRRYGSELWTDVDGRGSFVQIALAIDPMTPDNGPLRMLPGSHRQGFAAHPTTGELPPDRIDPDAAVDVALEPGDAAVFGPFVIHGSAPNRSDQPRRLLLQGYTLPGVNRRVYPGCGTGVPR